MLGAALKMKTIATVSLTMTFTLGLGLVSIAAGAAPKSALDVSGSWKLGCLDGYNKIVSVMDPKLIPDSLANGFEVKDGKAYLVGTPTVPWLSIYNADLQPLYHGLGYNSRSDELFQLVTTHNQPTPHVPALYQIEPFTGIRAVDLPDADFTFVAYHAGWCMNCKLQMNAIADFKQAHPELRIAHVQINADTRKMQKKKYLRQPCPVKT